MTIRIPVTYVSVWDDGFAIETTATYDTTTHEILAIEVVEGVDDEGDEVEQLIEEYIVLPDGTRRDVYEKGGRYRTRSHN